LGFKGTVSKIYFDFLKDNVIVLGKFCNTSIGDVSWLELEPEDHNNNATTVPLGLAGFSLSTLDKSFWIIGGYSFDFRPNITVFRYTQNQIFIVIFVFYIFVIENDYKGMM